MKNETIQDLERLLEQLQNSWSKASSDSAARYIERKIAEIGHEISALKLKQLKESK